MKLIKILSIIMTVAILALGMAATSHAETTPYEEALSRYEKMKGDYINVHLEFYGMYITKASKFYAREVTGVASDGTFILSPWRRLNELTYVTSYNDTYFNIPATYVQFGYSFDIVWGTDWPFSGVFWTDTSKDVRSIRIHQEGAVRGAGIEINVDGVTVFKDRNCASHSEWIP